MGLWDGVKRQLRSVIEWEHASPENLFELWSENGDEIKDASQLIIKPGQGAVFVYEGNLEAVMTKPGTYDLITGNVPFITTLKKFMQAFESEHKVGIYFFWQTEFLNQKWGTPTPIKYNDPVYNFPVGLRSFGNFSFKLTEPEAFFVNLLGARNVFKSDDLRQVVAERIQQPLVDVLAESGLSYAEIDAQREELAELLRSKVHDDFTGLGLELTDFRIEGTTFDEDTNARIGRIADITAEARAAQQAGVDYGELQRLEALREAARNEGGAAGAGVGIGAGIGLGQSMSQQMAGGGAPQASSGGDSVEARLSKLKKLLDQGLIDQADYDAKKKDILSEL